MEGSTVVTDPVPALEETEITSVGETGPGLAERTGNNGSGGGDGGEASSPWSLTEEQQVRNLKENWKRFLNWTHFPPVDLTFTFLDELFESIPWFSTAVAKLRVDPCLDSYDELEIDTKLSLHLVTGFRMKSLDVAILMGDLRMVQKILEETCFDLDKLLHGSPVDEERVMRRFLRAISPLKTGILYTPLHLAVLGGDIDIIDVLLDKGAYVDDKNWLGQMPLDYACIPWQFRSPDLLLKLLQYNTQGIHPIHIAVRTGDINFIKKLPSQNMNAMDYNRNTPLHYLAAYRHHNVEAFTSTMQYLAEDKKLDIKALNDGGLSALYLAIISSNTQFVIALLDSFKDQV